MISFGAGNDVDARELPKYHNKYLTVEKRTKMSQSFTISEEGVVIFASITLGCVMHQTAKVGNLGPLFFLGENR